MNHCMLKANIHKSSSFFTSLVLFPFDQASLMLIINPVEHSLKHSPILTSSQLDQKTIGLDFDN